MSRIIGFFGPLTSPTFAATALGTAIKVAVLLAVALIATRSLRRVSAAVRHSVWSATVVAALVLPLLTVAFPSWRMPVPGAGIAGALATRLSRAVENEPSLRPLALAELPAVAPTPGVATSIAPAQPRFDAPIDGSHDRLPLLLFSIWAFGFLVALVPLLAGALQLRAIARRAGDVESDILADFVARLARSSGIRRDVRVVEGRAAETPMTWGIWRPVVLVPRGFERWPSSRQREVILHELAHIARFDCLTQALARVLCALHWFDPLPWIAARRLRIERERACDDRVLLAGIRPSEYADHLLTIARSLRTPGAAGAAALAMARPSQLEDRLLALLDERRRRDGVSPRGAIAVGASALLAAAAVATFSPWSARRAEAIESARTRSAAVVATAFADTDPTTTAHRAPAPDSLLALLRTLPDSSLLSLLRAVHDDSLLASRRQGNDDSLLASLQHMPDDSLLQSLRQVRNDSLFDSLKLLLDRVGDLTGPGSARGTAFGIDSCTVADGRSSATSVAENDSHMKASVKHGDCEITLESEGKVGFDDAFTDITSLDKGGWLTISDARGSTIHRLHIVADAAGKPSRTWFVNGTQRPYDAEAASWLASTLRELDRHANLSRGARASSVRGARGGDGVLRP